MGRAPQWKARRAIYYSLHAGLHRQGRRCTHSGWRRLRDGPGRRPVPMPRSTLARNRRACGGRAQWSGLIRSGSRSGLSRSGSLNRSGSRSGLSRSNSRSGLSRSGSKSGLSRSGSRLGGLEVGEHGGGVRHLERVRPGVLRHRPALRAPPPPPPPSGSCGRGLGGGRGPPPGCGHGRTACNSGPAGWASPLNARNPRTPEGLYATVGGWGGAESGVGEHWVAREQ